MTTQVPVRRKKKNRRNIASMVMEMFNIERFMSIDGFMRNRNFVGFLFLLGLIYIYNAHLAQKNIFKINKMEREIKEKHGELITNQAQIQQFGRQSEIAKKLQGSGIKELLDNPYHLKLEQEK